MPRIETPVFAALLLAAACGAAQAAPEGAPTLSLEFDMRAASLTRPRLAIDQPGRCCDDVALGLEFRPANASTLAGLRQGTMLKANLSNSSTLRLRARGGQLMVQWRMQW